MRTANGEDHAKLSKTMPKIITRLVLFLIVFNGCNQKSEAEKEVEAIPLKIKVERFDKIFFEAGPEELEQVINKYPYFFPDQDPAIYRKKLQDPLWRELYSEVQKQYPDFSQQTSELEDLFKRAVYQWPQTRAPRVITLINEMDYDTKSIYADSLVLISLELYLGKDHRFYEFPAYLKQNFEPRQIAPDVAQSFAERKVPSPSDKSLLSLMLYHGKILYIKDVLLPDFSDAEKIGFLPEQIEWSRENEAYMWQYFIQGELLYSTDSKLPNRFINPAPFSKFYLEIDNDTPGSTGRWIGWQIVRAFMKNNDIKMHDMLAMDARELFEKSKYKPAKND
jgi:gliding motility-associated lipoprotein GldB